MRLVHAIATSFNRRVLYAALAGGGTAVFFAKLLILRLYG